MPSPVFVLTTVLRIGGSVLCLAAGAMLLPRETMVATNLRRGRCSTASESAAQGRPLAQLAVLDAVASGGAGVPSAPRCPCRRHQSKRA
jgi:hypothetical protein